MSGADRRELPGLNTFLGLVLTLTTLSNELPTALVSRLSASDTYKKYAVKQLKQDNLLRTFYRNGVRSLCLTTKQLLVEYWPDQFLPYLSGSTQTNQLKSEVVRRLRLHRMAEVPVTMLNTDVCPSCPEKSPRYSAPRRPLGCLPLTDHLLQLQRGQGLRRTGCKDTQSPLDRRSADKQRYLCHL